MAAPPPVLLICMALLLGITDVSHAQGCRSGWVIYSTFCYKFVARSLTTRGLAWEDAEITCESYGGHLASITDQNQQDFITKNVKIFNNEHFWIGYNDRANESYFNWTDGSDSNYSNWRRYEPNDYLRNEDCTEVVFYSGQWNDENCANEYSYICKRIKGAPWPTQGPLVPPTTLTPLYCDAGWDHYGSSCYKFNSVKKTWKAAQTDCHESGGYLVKVDNADEQHYLSYRLRLFTQTMWIGLTDSAVEGLFVWEGAGTVVNYTNWFPREPNDHSGKEDCVQMLSGYWGGFWNDNYCGQTRAYICEKPFGQNLCPVNWITFGNSCFELNTHPAQALTWTQARDSCRLTKGSDIASILSLDEQTFLLQQLKDLRARNVWIGLNDMTREGVFVWSDRSPVKYSNWSPNEPGSGTSAASKDCVLIESNSQNGTWSTTNCANRRTYVCRRKRGRDQCDSPLGMQNYLIDDSQITASSSLNVNSGPDQARLKLQATGSLSGAWCARTNANGEYLQIDLGLVRKIKHIALQGKPTSSDFVKTFYIRFGNDGLNFINYGENATVQYKVITGSSSSNTVANVMLSDPINGRFLRIYPLTWSNNICLRTEIYGCASAGSSTKCGVGWEEGPDDTCYQFNTNQLKIWADARATCNSRGGDLLSIVTNKEKTYIENRLKPLASSVGSLWIGLNDRESNRLFCWSDRSPYVITRWDAGYPKDTTNSKSCVELVASRAAWRDVDCGQYKPFVCKKKLVSPYKQSFSMTANWISAADFYWPLDNLNNGRALGSTPAQVVGNVTHPNVLQNGKDVLQFRRYNSYLNAGEYPRLCISDADICLNGLSLSFIIRLDATASSWSRTFLVDSIGDALLPTANSRGFSVYVESGQLQVSVFTTRLKWSASTTMSTGVWHHVMFTWQRGTGLQYYIDGKLKVNLPSGTLLTPTHTRNNVALTIGSKSTQQATGGYYMRALAVWNRVLSSNDVTDIFNAEFGVCRTGWKEFGQYCYQFNNDRRSWQAARLQCQNRGGDLVSITSPVEQAHISMEVGYYGLGTYTWIGFHDKSIESAWEWSDGSPVRFTNWYNVQPDNWYNREDCAHTYHMSYALGRWNDIACGTNMAYICKRKKEYNPSAGVSPTTAPRQQIICEWASDSISCPSSTVILVQSANYGRTDTSTCGSISVTNCRFDALSKVKNMCDGKTFCSIRPSNQLFGKDPCYGVRKYLDVTYVCKRGTDMTPGCPTGWQRSLDGNVCYGLILDKKTWHGAQDSCRQYGADLASVHSGWESSLITSLLVTSWDAGDVWIGLTDFGERGVYRWADNSTVDFTHWWNGEPNDRNRVGSCVRATMTVSSRDWMYWLDTDCTKKPYSYVCKKFRQNFTPPTKRPTTVPVGPCPTSWSTYKFGCYKVFFQRKTWTAARDACRATGQNTDLVSIHNTAENAFVQTLTNSSFNVWIGLNDRGIISGHLWSDGTAVQFTSWGPVQPDSHSGQQPCVVLKSTGSWNDVGCYSARPYMCKRKRPATAVTTVPVTSAPTTPTPAPGTCEPGWRYWRQMCYHFGNETLSNQRTWYDARAVCRQAGGDLLSIRNAAENAYIYTVFRVTYRSWTAWIGLNDLGQESVYEWTDGTPLAYTNYNWREPNDWQGQEDCLEILRSNGKWNDNQCNRKRPFICKKHNNTVVPVPPVSPTPGPALGRCNAGWIHYDKSCYKFVSSERQNWANARSRCDRGTNSTMYGDLTSIGNQYEQAFISSMMINYQSLPGFWIGLNDMHTENSFYWADNSPVLYTNWNTRQPQNRLYLDCVDIEPGSWAAGKWVVRPCSRLVGYICETAALPMSPTAVTPTASADCPASYSKYGDACYFMSYSKLNWYEAREVCKKNGADLISIHSSFEQAFLVSKMVNFVGNVWTGMIRASNSLELTWSDQSVKEYSHWSRGQPGQPGSSQTCVQANNSMNSDGRWTALDCGRTNGFMCKINKGEPHVTPHVNGKCLPGFKKFDKFCYLFRQFHRLTWPQARFRCLKEGGDLVSILNQQEKDFLIYQMKSANGIWVWTGLNDRSVERGYQWSDGSPVSFLSWNWREPNDHNGRENCVEVQTRSGVWNDLSCTQSRGYICKAKLECSYPLGMVSGNITNSQLSASSLLDAQHGPWAARINGSSAWCANTTTRPQYLQVDFQSPVQVSKISIKGTMLYRMQAFVKSFTVSYATYKDQWQTYQQNGATRVFSANWNANRILTSSVDPPIAAQYLRIVPIRWYFKICAQLEFYGCSFECQNALGMEIATITNLINASSESDPLHAATEARPTTGHGWCPQASDSAPWLQVTFPALERRITKISTWGANNGEQKSYVTKYRLAYSDDGSMWSDYTERGVVRTFRGNTDSSSRLTHVLAEPITTQYFRIKPLSGSTGGTCLRFEIYGCANGCLDPLGLELGTIEDSWLSSSSKLDENHGPDMARLNAPRGWCAATNDKQQYLQIDLHQVMRFRKVATQGCPEGYVKSFIVQFRSTQVWRYYREKQKLKVFTGNTDSTTVVSTLLLTPRRARVFRILPQTWFQKICLRVEFYGCPINNAPTMSPPTEIPSGQPATGSTVLPTTAPKDVTFNVTLKITSVTWVDDYKKRTSAAYKKLASQILKEVNALYSNNEDRASLAFENVKIIGFRRGSVIVDFNVTFIADIAKRVNVTMPLRAAVSTGSLGQLKVDPESLKITKIVSTGGKTSPQKKGRVSGMSAGAKAAVGFVVVLVILAGFAAGGWFLFKRHRAGKLMFQHQTFDNPIHFSSKAYDLDDPEPAVSTNDT